MVLFAIGILAYGAWTKLLIFLALIAESGKDSNPWLAAFLLWPLGELVWTFIWVVRHRQQYSTSRRRGLGEALVVLALILPVPLMFFLGSLLPETSTLPGEIFIVVPAATTIVACRFARHVWFSTGDDVAEVTPGA
jgi:hypothetical protein